jgi:hypothetical protein
MGLLPDPKAPLRFEASGGVTYLIRVPTVADLVALDRAWRVLGGRRWTLWQMIDALAAAVRAVLADETDADRVRHLELLAVHRETLVALAEEGRSIDPHDDTPAGKAALADWSTRWMEALSNPDVAALEEVLTVHVPAYREKLADNAIADELRGLAAARLFIVGWEGIAVAPKRSIDGLDETSLQMIPRYHLAGIGRFVDGAGRVPEGAEKN